jgi:hypothetical protein
LELERNGNWLPAIRDRVAQTAAKPILEPIRTADLEPNAHGYRPRKSAQDAIRKVDELLHGEYTDIVDANLSRYFDMSGDGKRGGALRKPARDPRIPGKRSRVGFCAW